MLWIVLIPAVVGGAVERYKVEADYLARLVELGFVTLHEGFEGKAWDGLRSNYPIQNAALIFTNNGIRWSSASHELWPATVGTTYITTNPNWARGNGWGLYDTETASTIQIEPATPIYGVGLWVDTNPDFQDVGFLFPGRTNINAPGYIIAGYGAMYPGDNAASGHEFIGVIDPDGITNVIVTGTLETNEEGVLEGAAVLGVDDFTFAIEPGAVFTPLQHWRSNHFAGNVLADTNQESTVWGNTADPDFDRMNNVTEYAFGGDPNIADSAPASLSASTYATNGALRLEFSYYRRTNDIELTYVPRVSTNLTTWESGTSFVVEVGITPAGTNFERVLCRDVSNPAPSQRVFGSVIVNGHFQ